MRKYGAPIDLGQGPVGSGRSFAYVHDGSFWKNGRVEIAFKL